MEKVIQLLVNQQAQFTKDVQHFVQQVNLLAQNQVGSENRAAQQAESLAILAKLAEKTDERLNRITDNLGMITNNIHTLSQRIEELFIAQTNAEKYIESLSLEVSRLSVALSKSILPIQFEPRQ
jgi:chromosome segregation ATPase